MSFLGLKVKRDHLDSLIMNKLFSFYILFGVGCCFGKLKKPKETEKCTNLFYGRKITGVGGKLVLTRLVSLR